MNKLFLVLLIVAQSAFAVTGNKVWRIPSGGSLPAWGPVNLADGTNAITGALPSHSNLPAVGQQVSSSCGNFTTSSTSFTTITNLSVSITTTGRPVQLFLQDDGSGSASFIAQNSGGSSASDIGFSFFRGVTQLNNMFINVPNGQTGGAAIIVSSLRYLDAPSAGTYTYTAQIKINTNQVAVNHAVLVAYEM